ncbi:D-isomer specific 2-hydroxyacid dehydrogenase family protein [Sandarakinorhabdus sp. DWP1-3-1]|uniref:D-isomer specific 2-hydroxyacid dehydrogenase family protein n=1 Tax=Sandarakinorhabdus sp. DWP1-3-1 TaxID=2804627 RepID=UPI003CED1A1D
MTALRVVSQLPEPFTATIAGGVAGIDIIHIPRGVPDAVPDDARILLAAPFSRPGDLPAKRPKGWPFNIDWIQLVSVGIDFYPPWLFEGPVVTSARGSSSVALAEFALAAIFAQAKHLPDIWIDGPDRWASTPLAAVEGSTLGIIGFGSIAEALAPRAQALGMRVIATRRTDAPFAVDGVTRVDTDTLFATADHVVLAAPLTADTRHLVDVRRLALAKPGQHIINIARGGLIDDKALLAALDAGSVTATLDVTEPEPLPAGHPYYSHPRVRLSPHSSVATPDTRAALARRFAENVDRYRAGLALANIVDASRGY